VDTLDGVVQAPGAPDEDESGSFEHGGWHLPYFEAASQKWVVETLTEAGGFLLGRRTYGDGARRPLRVIESQVTTTGAILATFAPVAE
jgi:hypothetical protein